jgi:hypothetical protein
VCKLSTFALGHALHRIGLNSLSPISTYGYKGAIDRPDINQHSIIYTSAQGEPAALAGESFINAAIPIDALDNQQLHPSSRVNYSKTYTIEHNVLIKKLGKVQKPHVPYLIEYWKQANGLGADTATAP